MAIPYVTYRSFGPKLKLQALCMPLLVLITQGATLSYHFQMKTQIFLDDHFFNGLTLYKI